MPAAFVHRFRRAGIGILVCLGVWMTTLSGQQPAPGDAPYVPGEVIVRFSPQAPPRGATRYSNQSTAG